MLLNLTNNAIKFTDKGGVTIQVTGSELTPTHTGIEIRIKDSGIVISPNFLETGFDSFKQADESKTRWHRVRVGHQQTNYRTDGRTH